MRKAESGELQSRHQRKRTSIIIQLCSNDQRPTEKLQDVLRRSTSRVRNTAHQCRIGSDLALRLRLCECRLRDGTLDVEEVVLGERGGGWVVYDY